MPSVICSKDPEGSENLMVKLESSKVRFFGSKDKTRVYQCGIETCFILKCAQKLSIVNVAVLAVPYVLCLVHV